MMSLIAVVLVFHLAGMVMWIGGLFMALAAAKPGSADAAARSERARLAQSGMRRMAHPGAALMVLSGALLFYLLPEVRLAPWMHAKLGLVAVLIVLDLLLAARVRRLPAEDLSAGQMGMFHGTIGLVWALILVLVVVKPF